MMNGALESPDQELSFYASVDVNDPYATTLWAWKVWAASAAIVPIVVPSTNCSTKYQLQYQVPIVVPSTKHSTVGEKGASPDLAEQVCDGI